MTKTVDKTMTSDAMLKEHFIYYSLRSHKRLSRWETWLDAEQAVLELWWICQPERKEQPFKGLTGSNFETRQKAYFEEKIKLFNQLKAAENKSLNTNQVALLTDLKNTVQNVFSDTEKRQYYCLSYGFDSDRKALNSIVYDTFGNTPDEDVIRCFVAQFLATGTNEWRNLVHSIWPERKSTLAISKLKHHPIAHWQYAAYEIFRWYFDLGTSSYKGTKSSNLPSLVVNHDAITELIEGEKKAGLPRNEQDDLDFAYGTQRGWNLFCSSPDFESAHKGLKNKIDGWVAQTEANLERALDGVYDADFKQIVNANGWGAYETGHPELWMYYGELFRKWLTDPPAFLEKLPLDFTEDEESTKPIGYENLTTGQQIVYEVIRDSSSPLSNNEIYAAIKTNENTLELSSIGTLARRLQTFGLVTQGAKRGKAATWIACKFLYPKQVEQEPEQPL